MSSSAASPQPAPRDADWFLSGSERSGVNPSLSRFESFNVSIYPILIVDDNEGVCILIARMLSNIGFKSIFIANSAKQAYDVFGTQMAELERDPIIFLDLRLPDVPGERVAKKIMEIRPSSRIILVTAEDSSAESSQEAMRQGAAAYIQKPIGLSKIRNVLADILEEMEGSASSSSSSSHGNGGNKFGAARENGDGGGGPRGGGRRAAAGQEEENLMSKRATPLGGGGRSAGE